MKGLIQHQNQTQRMDFHGSDTSYSNLTFNHLKKPLRQR